VAPLSPHREAAHQPGGDPAHRVGTALPSSVITTRPADGEMPIHRRSVTRALQNPHPGARVIVIPGSRGKHYGPHHGAANRDLQASVREPLAPRGDILLRARHSRSPVLKRSQPGRSAFLSGCEHHPSRSSRSARIGVDDDGVSPYRACPRLAGGRTLRRDDRSGVRQPGDGSTAVAMTASRRHCPATGQRRFA
jgi:hypothetical protein